MEDKVIKFFRTGEMVYVKTRTIKVVSVIINEEVKDTYDLKIYIENIGWIILAECLSIQLADEMARKLLEEGELQYY